MINAYSITISLISRGKICCVCGTYLKRIDIILVPCNHFIHFANDLNLLFNKPFFPPSRFRSDFIAFRKSVHEKKRRLSEENAHQLIVYEKETTLLDDAISYFFGLQKQSRISNSPHISNKSRNSSHKWITTSGDMRQIWDLDSISIAF